MCSLTANWQFLHFPTCFPVVKCSVTENCLSFYIFLHASPSWSAPWQKTGSVSTFFNVLPRREVLRDRKLPQFLHFSTCFPVMKCSVTENWLSFYIFQQLFRREVLRDRKLPQFLHFPTCFPVVKCSVTENCLSFYIFQRAFPLWSAPWQKTDSVSTFSNMLPRREVLRDNKLTRFQRLDLFRNKKLDHFLH
jgi:hypothetical protein